MLGDDQRSDRLKRSEQDFPTSARRVIREMKAPERGERRLKELQAGGIVIIIEKVRTRDVKSVDIFRRESGAPPTMRRPFRLEIDQLLVPIER
jgi:hypothetical protein